MGKKRKADEAHRRTDKKLAELETRIAAEYKKAADELSEKIKDYFERLKERDAVQAEMLLNGEITKQEYIQWRLAQIGRGKRFQALRDRIAERMTHANEVAAAYINDQTPGIYSLNRNYAAYTIEQQVGQDVGFDLWDEQTVKRLIVDQPDIMPYYPEKRAVQRGIDLAWGKRQITVQVTTGILQGESIKHLADRLQFNIPGMNRTSAIRAARTAVTGAQNAGRLDGFLRAEEMGVKLKKRWLATLDNRTRHAHKLLDGQVRPNEKPFVVEGQEIMYPGDPSAAAALVYNCRCTLVAEVEGVDTSDSLRRDRWGLLPNMTFAQWENTKWGEGALAAERYAKKDAEREAKDRKQYAEYKAILGKNAPKSFVEFQDLKYNYPDKWDYTKRLITYLQKYPNSNKKFFDVQEILRAQGIDKKGVVLPPVQKQAFILPEGKRDPYHIMHRMMERNITDDEIRGYMSEAKIMIVQWGGRRQRFVGENGMCVVTKIGEDWIYKTAWKKSDYDEMSDKIMEAIKNAGL